MAGAEFDGWLTVGITGGDTAGALSSIGLDFDGWRTAEVPLRTPRLPNPAAELAPGGAVDMIVEKRLEECGTHTLRVSVAYGAAAGGEPKSLRKFYRFNVLSPRGCAADESRRRRGRDAEIPWRRGTPRPGRRRGRDAHIPRRRGTPRAKDVAIRWRPARAHRART